jgi:molecular chaperone GrpE
MAATTGNRSHFEPHPTMSNNDANSAPQDTQAAQPDLNAEPQLAPNGADAATPESQLALIQAQLTEAQDAFLRAKAETENVRRRADEEVSKARKFAVDAFAESLLPVKDSLEAAIAMPDAPVEKVLEGVHATLRQLQQALERNKVLEINPPAGTKFDPHQHQAISMVPAEQDANTVVAVLQKGYLIAERVLRPALVTVAAPK